MDKMTKVERECWIAVYAASWVRQRAKGHFAISDVAQIASQVASEAVEGLKMAHEKEKDAAVSNLASRRLEEMMEE